MANATRRGVRWIPLAAALSLVLLMFASWFSRSGEPTGGYTLVFGSAQYTAWQAFTDLDVALLVAAVVVCLGSVAALNGRRSAWTVTAVGSGAMLGLVVYGLAAPPDLSITLSTARGDISASLATSPAWGAIAALIAAAVALAGSLWMVRTPGGGERTRPSVEAAKAAPAR